MEVYTHFFSTYNYQGKRLLVDIFEWAKLSMTEQQYLIFSKEYQEVVDFYLSLNGYSEEVIYSTVAKSFDIQWQQVHTKKLVIGLRHIFQDKYVPNPQWNFWHERFASDPNVEYRSLQLES